MPLDITRLESTLAAIANGRQAPARYVVAFSGGVDSAVLLHLASGLDDGVPLVALHVDHGLHPESARWAEQAANFAAEFGVECRVVKAEITDSGHGLEAAARTARYAAFDEFLSVRDWLLSAHHRDDQAETLLLNLIRGSGTLGLAAMPPARPCGHGLLVRPFLDAGRDEIHAYAREHGLDWQDDPSNADRRFDRNFIRHELVPILGARWPGVGKALARSAEIAADTQTLLDALAADDLERIGAATPGRLPLGGLRGLDARRQANLLRYACRQASLPTPPVSRLREIQRTLLNAADDAQPIVAWAGASVRRYRDTVFLLEEGVACDLPTTVLTPDGSVSLGAGLGTLSLQSTAGPGIAPDAVAAGLTVAPRQGGERLKPTLEGATRRLKSLLQEAAILPWMRDRLPLLVLDGELVAVGDLWVDAAFQAEPGYAVVWEGKPDII